MKVFRNSLLVAVVLLWGAGLVSASNSLSVNNAAAQDGNYGLEISLDGSSNAAYVQDNSPTDETTYRASFWIHRNDLSMDNCGGSCSTRFVAFLARQEDPGVTVFRIIVARLAVDGPLGPRYAFRFGVRNDGGDFVYMGGVILTGGVMRKHVTVEWQAGDPFTQNGIARLYTSNDGGTPNLQFERTTLQNGTMNIDHVTIGAASGLSDQPTDVNSTGSWYFDSFESYRTLLP
jgi:hypothetical protein